MHESYGAGCLGTGLFNSLSFYVKLSDVKVNDEGGWEDKFTPLPQLGYISSVEGITWRICQQKQQTTLVKFTKNFTNHSNPIDLKIGNTSSKMIQNQWVFQERQVSDAVGKA